MQKTIIIKNGVGHQTSSDLCSTELQITSKAALVQNWTFQANSSSCTSCKNAFLIQAGASIIYIIAKIRNYQLLNYNTNYYKFLTLYKMFKKRNVKEQKQINLSESDSDEKKKEISAVEQKENQDCIDGSLPSKKVKTQFTKSVLVSTTTDRKQKNAQQLHKNFKSLNYKADQNIRPEYIIKNADEALKLQEEIAKQKFLQNVEMTKLSKQGKIDPKVYRGTNAYANHSLTEDQIKNAQQNYKKRCGPSRVSSTIKNTCRFDYNLSLCKDWHDSGYCPFGNSCIYLHDRSNYKTGWEQEKDFQRAEKQRWRRINNPDLAVKQQIQESLKSIQKYKVEQLCKSCNNPFKNPVQVDCGHIFCTLCAIKMNKCITCKKSLSGIMNAAQKKIQKMRQTYNELKTKIEKQNQQSRVKRKKYQNIQSQDVFAD